MEIWKKIDDAPAYSVSDIGRVRRDIPDHRGIGVGRILRPSRHRRGYMAHVLCVDGRKITRKVHRLVCEAFNGPQPAARPHCAHRDGDVANNTPDNLYWATATENAEDRDRHGRTFRGPNYGTRGFGRWRGQAMPQAKLTEAQAVEILTAPRIFGSGRELAERYGVSMGLISAIRKGRAWAHLPRPR